MALTCSTIALLAQLVGKPYVAVAGAVPVVTAVLDAEDVAEIESQLTAIAAAYEPVADSSFGMGGGRDGVSLSDPAEVKSMRRRAQVLLSMDVEPNGSALQAAVLCGPRWS